MNRSLLRLNRRVGIVLSIGIAVAIVALAYALGVPLGPTYKVATHYAPRDGARALTGFVGLLAGQVNGDGTACFWIENDPSDRTALMWPNGYLARRNPLLSIFDENGHRRGTVGQLVEFDGATAAPEDIIAQGRTKGIPGCPPMSRVELIAPP